MQARIFATSILITMIMMLYLCPTLVTATPSSERTGSQSGIANILPKSRAAEKTSQDGGMKRRTTPGRVRTSERMESKIRQINKPKIGKIRMAKKTAEIDHIKNEAAGGSGKGAEQQRKASCCGSASAGDSCRDCGCTHNCGGNCCTNKSCKCN